MGLFFRKWRVCNATRNWCRTVIACGAGALALCVAAPTIAADGRPPPYDSTADTVFDIITADDPSSFRCLTPLGHGARQIWDKRVDGEPVVEALLFVADYSDGASIEIAVNPEFLTVDKAREEAMRYAVPLGRLPSVLRMGVKRFSIHQGDEGFHAGTGQIVVYAGRAARRIEKAHLEESLFHEAVHAALDDDHRMSVGWRDAQRRDGGFLTSYGQATPDREDLAETALFAFALLHHPERFPPVDTETVRQTVPNRLAYIAQLFPQGQPSTSEMKLLRPCLGDHS
nr:hypothetical protein [uncultured Shinella sp.]